MRCVSEPFPKPTNTARVEGQERSRNDAFVEAREVGSRHESLAGGRREARSVPRRSLRALAASSKRS